jgi:hypothetical protein
LTASKAWERIRGLQFIPPLESVLDFRLPAYNGPKTLNPKPQTPPKGVLQKTETSLMEMEAKGLNIIYLYSIAELFITQPLLKLTRFE